MNLSGFLCIALVLSVGANYLHWRRPGGGRFFYQPLNDCSDTVTMVGLGVVLVVAILLIVFKIPWSVVSMIPLGVVSIEQCYSIARRRYLRAKACAAGYQPSQPGIPLS